MKSSQPLHQQQVIVAQNELLDQQNCISTMKQGDRRFLEDYQRRGAPIMELPMLPLSNDSSYLGEKLRFMKVNNAYRNKTDISKKTNDESSPISVIDGILEVIGYDYSEDEDDEEVMVIPVKMDNYVSKRSRLSKANRRRKELLLDNGSAITEALRLLEEDRNMAELVLSSGDEESIDAGDIDEDYDSDSSEEFCLIAN
jgi:hypothetical protein